MTDPNQTTATPPYQGDDMLGHMAETGFKLAGDFGPIRFMVNIQDTAIIVTDQAIYRAKPDWGCGFYLERVMVL